MWAFLMVRAIRWSEKNYKHHKVEPSRRNISMIDIHLIFKVYSFKPFLSPETSKVLLVYSIILAPGQMILTRRREKMMVISTVLSANYTGEGMSPSLF
jgi:hypothetical protein